jgi:hypothetical protein
MGLKIALGVLPGQMRAAGISAPPSPMASGVTLCLLQVPEVAPHAP